MQGETTLPLRGAIGHMAREPILQHFRLQPFIVSRIGYRTFGARMDRRSGIA
jgi:hypothetical protein